MISFRLDLSSLQVTIISCGLIISVLYTCLSELFNFSYSLLLFSDCKLTIFDSDFKFAFSFLY
ncbi:unnamed protein product [Schistosoma curassoni]|uniref:Ovule protein n=1 Tax=Schistosoma curassoni TaxID=6186 RepID=A0A183JI37_9TREM|nr:unnamed protein product [Schistosoma curassoni]